MDEGNYFDTESVYQEIRDRARGEGVSNQEAWNELVELILDEHINAGEFNPDEDLIELREDLQSRYPEFAAENP